MAFIESRKKFFSLILASSLSGMSNFACLAAQAEKTNSMVPLWQEEAVGKMDIGAGAPPVINAPDADPVIISTNADSQGIIDQIMDGDLPDENTNRLILESPLLIAAAQPTEIAAAQNDPLILSGGASMTPDEACLKVDNLTRDILLKEIELERYNLNYTRQVNIQGRWKGWRYTGLQEVNGGMGLAGAIISIGYRGARVNNPKSVKPCIQESANYIPMIGSYIGAGAAGMEFGINEYHDMMARRHGYGPAQALRKVSGIKSDIDRMLAQRDQLIRVEAAANNLSGQVEIDNIENKVLSDMLDQSLQEFERFHVGARRNIAFQQMQYFLDFSKYTINSLGYQFAYLSLHRHRRRYNGNAGALWMVAGGIYMMAPIVSRFFGKGWAELTRYDTEHALGHSYKASISTLETDLARLDTLAKQTKLNTSSARSAERATDRVAHYADHEKCYTDELRSAQKAKNKAVLTATQNVGAAIFVGGTKEAQGILFGIPGFNHRFNAGSKSNRSNQVTNNDLLTASIISVPATAYSMLDSLRIQIKGEINRHKLAAKGELPGQIVTKRLAQLDIMEKRLKSGN